MSGIVDWEADPAGQAADAHDGDRGGGGDGARPAEMTVAHAVARAFAAAVESGRLDLPHPGSGRTRERWAVLADLAGEDLCLARLAEGHADALAVLAELGAAVPAAGRRWGVWPAQPGGPWADRSPGPRRVAAGRGQAVLLRRPFVYGRAGHGGSAGRRTAVRRQYPRSVAHSGHLAGHRHGRQRHP